MSPHHAMLLAFAAQEVMNYHCADLIESFGNLVSLKWPTNSPASTKMNIEHYAIDLLRQIHTANIECYYNCAFDSYKYITDQSRTKEAHNPHNLMQNNTGHLPDRSVPDRRWGNNFINDTLIHVANIEDAIHEIVETLNSINHTVELISPVYPDGMPTIPPSLNVQKILKEVLTKLDSGPPEDPTRWRFTLYKTHRKERTEKTCLYHPLPNKPTDTSTISECPTPHPLSPPPPPLPSQSMPSMDDHALERPTKPSSTFSTTNHMSDSLPPHPYRHTSCPQTITNERRSSNSSRTRLRPSTCSRNLSMRFRPTTRSLRRVTPLHTPRQHGETSGLLRDHQDDDIRAGPWTHINEYNMNVED